MSLLVPLFRESGVARQLVARLARLDYPRGLLEVVLVLEDHDDQTRAALDATDLPPWFRVAEVPEGRIRTKPRALNHALGLCRGEIVGIYDAEDAPDRDQLLRVARAFQRGPPELACIQGILDYYNARGSWIARCFTIEYATWFRLLLPGLARLRLAIPLGGTTVFLRREALEELGGWDAHNVTEDADLGIRLARHGYRTELIPSVTREEANDRLWPWVRQRSRWLKGYMVTYLVHMRNPALLWRQFGPRRFLGFQIFFLAALSQFVMGPLLWTFWLVPAGLPHPLASLFGPAGLMAVGVLLLAGAATDLCAALLAVRATDHRGLGRWVPSLLFYFPLATLAAYKALWELVFQPFYWDKTEHGRSHAPEPPEPGTEGGTAP
ncbi:glycosyltransferase [Aquicoccus sp. SCR17]|nr:glycosyltransferase [Carideicomes alvinocaridis]